MKSLSLTKIFVSIVLLFCGLSITAQTHTPKPNVSITSNSNGYYEYLPQGYNPYSTEKYPLILYIHGMGESGNGSSADLPRLLNAGPAAYINWGLFPTSFTSGGQSHKFIILTPQFVNWPSSADVETLLQYAINNYNVNINKIYLTGISMGGGVTMLYASESIANANKLAAIVPVCAAHYPWQPYSEIMAAANLPVWATTNETDYTVPAINTINTITWMNAAPTPPNPLAKLSIFPVVGHDAWTKTYNPTFKENGMNIYEWMLQYQRNQPNPPPNVPGNLLPIANAGNDITIQLPVNNITLNGSGTDPDGTITSYQWTKMSGGTAIITNVGAATTTVTGMSAGYHQFQLRITDNNGGVATDVINVTVNAAPVNQTPFANAGLDQVITLPNNATLTGWGIDPDGTVVSYLWTKLTGPASGTITNPSNSTTTVTNLVAGIYTFEVKLTDNGGGIATDVMQLTVNPGVAVPNQLPVANAGSDINITLPANSVTLNGTATDADGTIASYQWSQVSGPYCTMGTVTSATSVVSNLSAGTYQFQLRVTDNSGGIATDNIQVIVNAAVPTNQSPVSNAGSDVWITLPVQSASLNGSGTDPDGTVTAYLWTKISGPAAGTLTNATSAVASVTSLAQGTYKYELRVTDNNGAFAKDTMQVFVAGSTTTPNQTPFGNAGTDVTITLPTNTVTLTGWGIDPDGTVEAYYWTKISGPSAGTITNPGLRITTVTGMIAGIYNFQVMLTDNSGGTSTDVVQITVNPGSGPVPVNQLPVSNAGSDVWITLPVQSASLNGSGTDPDGTVTAYLWTKISGPAAGTLTNATSAVASVTSLAQGTYKYELRVTDNNGAFAKDTMQVFVAGSTTTPNQTPFGNAGTDVTITLPTNTVTLTGWGIDPDGTVEAYYWTKISGPATGTITNPGQRITTVTGMVAGTYNFQVQLTDNSGGTATDVVQVTVNPGTGPAPVNQLPVANAGNDISITLPVNNITMAGSGSDPDGTIASYMWSKISGPACTITNTGSASTTVTSLSAGTYQFQLQVTDNSGATATDIVAIVVSPASTPVPTNGNAIYVNLFDGTVPFIDPKWNNWQPSTNVTSSSFKYENGSQSSVTANLSEHARFADNWLNYATGATVCPPAVLRFNSVHSMVRTLTISGLNPANQYSFEFYGSALYTNNSKSIFTSGGVSDTITTDLNENDFAQLTVTPDITGKVIVTLSFTGSFNYLAGFKISELTTSPLTSPLVSNSTNKGEVITDEIKATNVLMNVYPNPFVDHITVQFPNNAPGMYDLQITDATGKVVIKKSFKNTNGTSERIQLNNLKNGSYFLQIISKSGKTGYKLLKL